MPPDFCSPADSSACPSPEKAPSHRAMLRLPVGLGWRILKANAVRHLMGSRGATSCGMVRQESDVTSLRLFVVFYGVACLSGLPWAARHAGMGELRGTTPLAWVAFFSYSVAVVFWLVGHAAAWSRVEPGRRPTFLGRNLSAPHLVLLYLVPVVNVVLWFRVWPALLRETAVLANCPEEEGDTAERLGRWLAVFNTLDHATWWLGPLGLIYLPISAALHGWYHLRLGRYMKQMGQATPADPVE